MSEQEPLEEGARNKEEIEYELPSGRGLYNWKKIKKAVENGEVYVLPMEAKHNSILTGLRREEIDARVGTVKDSEQLVIVPT